MYVYVYMYIYICVCVCVRVCVAGVVALECGTLRLIIYRGRGAMFYHGGLLSSASKVASLRLREAIGDGTGGEDPRRVGGGDAGRGGNKRGSCMKLQLCSSDRRARAREERGAARPRLSCSPGVCE